MIREAKEELLIEIEEEYLNIIHVLHHYKGDRVNFILTTDTYKGIPVVGEPEKCEKVEWFDINQLPDNTTSKVKFIIKKIKNDIFYSKL